MRPDILVALALVVAALCLAPTEGRGATYHVDAEVGSDTATGSLMAPWRTVERANKVRLQPGDELLFRRGQRFQGELILRNGGNRNAPIVIGAFGEGEKPVIEGGSGGISVVRHSHGIIRDLSIRNVTGSGIFLDWANDWTITNVEVSGTNDTGIVSWHGDDIVLRDSFIHDTRGDDGIKIYGAHGITIERNTVMRNHGARADNMHIVGSGYRILDNKLSQAGVTDSGKGNLTVVSFGEGGLVSGNEFHSAPYGLAVLGDGNAVIRDNLFVDHRRVSYSTAIMIHTGEDSLPEFQKPLRNLQIVRNVIRDAKIGIYAWARSPERYGLEDFLILENKIINTSRSGMLFETAIQGRAVRNVIWAPDAQECLVVYDDPRITPREWSSISNQFGPSAKCQTNLEEIEVSPVNVTSPPLRG